MLMRLFDLTFRWSRDKQVIIIPPKPSYVTYMALFWTREGKGRLWWKRTVFQYWSYYWCEDRFSRTLTELPGKLTQ